MPWPRTRSCVLLAAVVAGCASAPPPAPTPVAAPAAAPPAPARSLYDRLGGLPAIEAVTDSFLANVAADKRIAWRFALTDLTTLRTRLVEQLCQATGGPCTYTGADMATAHRHQRVTSADFDALVEDLAAALDAHHVPAAEKGELLGALAGMKPAIVEQ